MQENTSLTKSICEKKTELPKPNYSRYIRIETPSFAKANFSNFRLSLFMFNIGILVNNVN
jgi:hypothetical protein